MNVRDHHLFSARFDDHGSSMSLFLEPTVMPLWARRWRLGWERAQRREDIEGVVQKFCFVFRCSATRHTQGLQSLSSSHGHVAFVTGFLDSTVMTCWARIWRLECENATSEELITTTYVSFSSVLGHSATHHVRDFWCRPTLMFFTASIF